MKRSPRPSVEVNLKELDQIIEEGMRTPLSESDGQKLKAVLHALVQQAMPLWRTTEKTRAVLETEQGPAPAAENTPAPSPETEPAGHGRNAAAVFSGARKVAVPHPELKPGDPCPECGEGKVYRRNESKTLVRIVGQPPLEATVYEMERLRCNGCGQLFTAEVPQEAAGADKYDATAAAMIAQLRYGSGMPFKRLERLQANLGIPLPAATQWEVVEQVAGAIRPAYDELTRQAAAGEVMHNDDTGMRILRLAREPSDERTGIFTSGIVSIGPGWKIALYFSGSKHAGENPGRRAAATPIRAGSPDPDVRCALAQHPAAVGRRAGSAGQLHVAWQAPVRGRGGKLSRGMPSRAEDAGRRLAQRRAGAKAEAVAAATAAFPSGAQRSAADKAGGVDEGATGGA